PGPRGRLASGVCGLAGAVPRRRRDWDSDDLTGGGLGPALLARAERLFDRSDLALVISLDHEEPGAGRADLGELIEGSRRAVVGDHDLVDQGRVGAAGADRRELASEVIDRLRHLRFRLAEDWIDHGSITPKTPRACRSPRPSPHARCCLESAG